MYRRHGKSDRVKCLPHSSGQPLRGPEQGDGNMQTGQKVGKPGPNRPFWSGNGRGDILDRISMTVRQAGTVVVVAGGAGMGKTRLAFETTGRIEAAGIPCRVLEGTRR